MFAPEEIIVLSELEMQSHEHYRPHLQIEIPSMPDFGDFEELPRGPPVLKKHMADHLGDEDDNSVASTESMPEESQFQFAQSSPSTPTLPDSEEEEPEYVVINVCGYNYSIITTGLTQDEIEQEILAVENEALEYLLDCSDNRFM